MAARKPVDVRNHLPTYLILTDDRIIRDGKDEPFSAKEVAENVSCEDNALFANDLDQVEDWLVETGHEDVPVVELATGRMFVASRSGFTMKEIK